MAERSRLEIALGEVGRAEAEAAAGVLARGMRDNPVNRAAFGENPLGREQTLERLFGALLPGMRHAPVCARRSGEIVGVLGLAPPGACKPTPRQAARLVPAVLRAGPPGMFRTFRWFVEWERRHPREPHWHLGPVAVEPALQGMGIGGVMMERFVEVVDAAGETAYLETDKPENVRFYERFGFEVTSEAAVLDTPNWFMRRSARTGENR